MTGALVFGGMSVVCFLFSVSGFVFPPSRLVLVVAFGALVSVVVVVFVACPVGVVTRLATIPLCLRLYLPF